MAHYCFNVRWLSVPDENRLAKLEFKYKLFNEEAGDFPSDWKYVGNADEVILRIVELYRGLDPSERTKAIKKLQETE